MRDIIDIILLPVLGTIITAVVSYLGVKIKNILEKYFTEKQITEAAKTCVQAVEQLYKDLHGEDKYNKCVEQLSAMLAEKGISITELEIRMLIESAVQQMNITIKEAANA